jgi:hypothetical protein
VQAPGQGNRAWGLLAGAALFLGLVGAVFASASPDVLEGITEQTGIAGRATSLFSTPFADYEWQAVSAPWARKAAAGLFGLSVIYLICVASARLLRRRSTVS